MLELRGIKKTYYLGREAQADALKGISLSFPDQGMVFVVGKSGSGKSTLLNILGGLDSPTGGDLLINGRSISEFRSQDFDRYRNSQVGFVFQEYNLVDHLTVRENIALALDLQGKADSQQVAGARGASRLRSPEDFDAVWRTEAARCDCASHDQGTADHPCG